jgi:hypothetical protein
MIWRDISIDFVEGLPNSQGKFIIYVLWRIAFQNMHILLHSSIRIQRSWWLKNLLRMFLNYMDSQLPLFVIEIQLLQVISGVNFFCCKERGSISILNRQTDGQTEVVNRTLEIYLRCFTGDTLKDRIKWLSWVEYTYNTNYHYSTGKSPFELLYGRPAPSLLSYIPSTARIESVGQLLEARDTLLKQARLKLSQAQNRMKQLYDKGHKERGFQIGDLVYVRLHPYRQQTVARRLNMKLAAKFYGPYKVLERIGEVTYKLELPQGSIVHLVYHVSLLKKQWGSNSASSTILPEVPQDIPQLVPQAVLDVKGKDKKREVLVHWCGHNPTDATWENVNNM